MTVQPSSFVDVLQAAQTTPAAQAKSSDEQLSTVNWAMRTQAQDLLEQRPISRGDSGHENDGMYIVTTAAAAAAPEL